MPLLEEFLHNYGCVQNSAHLSPIWKETEVVGIQKPGKSSDLPASYRPISLLSGLGVPQGSTLSLFLHSAFTNDIPPPSSGVQLVLFTDDTALYFRARNPGRLGAILGRKSKLSQPNKRTIYKMCLRTAMAYASPVFAHAAPKALNSLQVIQNKFCRVATDAHWCVWNSIFHKDLELPTIAKYMKNISKRFFDITELHPNVLLRSAASHEAQFYHLIRGSRNVLIDPPDALTAKVESLLEVNGTHN
ncbi:RNA-directed DNA polymerase from mobile element jockey [Eumeta japonica]|uniref:RNA-directed DNA polymerase from mobile element jockey n=1 Tax=Eumeta variegata TaxID=151549 RepID=A0A4C1V9Y9_EUMVA|nr:RNA-directed DNA polymerase from mobile element jockey [Eumeta japonica]